MASSPDHVETYFLRPSKKEERPTEKELRWRPRYLHFELSHIKPCIEALEGADTWTDEKEATYRRRLWWFNHVLIPWPRYVWLAVAAAAYLVVQQPSVEARLNRLSAWLGGHVNALPLATRIALFLLVVFVGFRLWYTTRGIRPRAQFFRAVARGIYIARSKKHPQAKVVALNYVGQAARALFRDLRRGRSGTAPPMVSDWAERVACCLIDVRLLQPEGTNDRLLDMTTVYTRFIYDAASLVAVRREELIPELRKRYASVLLPPVDDSELTERNKLFLNPLRDHPRWLFVKDFVYPLAAWLSLVVAVVAVGVGIFR